jgi:ribosomal protein S18 acetylase RimI-like enzyme
MVPPLAAANSMTVVAEDDSRLVGFVHVVFDDDHRWGSLIDNLQITPHRRRSGIDTALLSCAAKADAERATGTSTYLSVLEQNTVAQQFYRTFGGTRIERP